MTKEKKLSDLLNIEIGIYENKIHQLKEDDNGNLTDHDKDTLNYLNGRRDGIAWVKLFMRDLQP